MPSLSSSRTGDPEPGPRGRQANMRVNRRRARGAPGPDERVQPLELQTEEKYYAAGVGEILERLVKGHH